MSVLFLNSMQRNTDLECIYCAVYVLIYTYDREDYKIWLNESFLYHTDYIIIKQIVLILVNIVMTGIAI